MFCYHLVTETRVKVLIQWFCFCCKLNKTGNETYQNLVQAVKFGSFSDSNIHTMSTEGDDKKRNILNIKFSTKVIL